MPDLWLDTDSLVTPSRGPYRFGTLPKFWDYLEQKAEEQVIASSEFVLKELIGSDEPDELETWAKRLGGKLFLSPDQAVQQMFSQIAESVKNNSRYDDHQVAKFLNGADPWLIAHAKALGGRVVTSRSESLIPGSRRSPT